MRTVSVRTPFIGLVLSAGLLLQWQVIPPAASRLVYIRANRTETTKCSSASCALRYAIVNPFSRLDNDSQRGAIRAGFVLWQAVDSNTGFLEFSTPDGADLLIQSVDPALTATQSAGVDAGLSGGSVTPGATRRIESMRSYTILRSNAVDCYASRLTKAMARHAGLFLGMAIFSDLPLDACNIVPKMYPCRSDVQMLTGTTGAMNARLIRTAGRA